MIIILKIGAICNLFFWPDQTFPNLSLITWLLKAQVIYILPAWILFASDLIISFKTHYDIFCITFVKQVY